MYNLESQKMVAFAERYQNSIPLHPLNRSAAAINLPKSNKMYKKNWLSVNQT